MPQVPSLANRRVGPSVIRQPETNAAAQAGAGVVAGLGTAAQMIQREVDTARQRGNEIRLNAAEVRVRELRNRILNDRDKGVLNQRGERAFKAPEDAEREWTTGLSAISAELGDPDVREVFNARASQLGVELRDVVNRHVTGEMDRVDAMTTEQIVKDTMTGIADTATDTERVSVDIVRAEEALRGRLVRQGVPEDVRDAAIAEVRSNARLAQVQALADAGDPNAGATLTAHWDEIAPSERKKARDYVDAADLTARAQRISDDLYDAFKNDEAGAIREAERTYEGKERDAVVNRLEVAFARQRRLDQEEVKSYTDRAMTEAYAGRGVSRETSAWLESNGQGRVLRAAQEVQKAVVEGEPIQTNLATYQELRNLLLPENRRKFLETNLLEYADRISRQDLTEFIDAQVALGGGTTRPASGSSTAAVMTELFNQAQGSRMFGQGVERLGDLETRPVDKEIYNVLRAQVETNIAALRSTQKGEPSTAQVREIIRTTLDGYIIEDKGAGAFNFGNRVAVPRPASPLTVPLSPEALTRAQALKAQGSSAEQIAAILQREGLLPPTP